MRYTATVVVLLFWTGAFQAAYAQTEVRPYALKYDLSVDLPILVAGGVSWIALELAKPAIAPETCRWCGVDGFDNSVRNALRWSNTSTANTLSSVLAYGVVPVFALGIDAFAAHDARALNEFPADAMIIGEAVVLAGNVAQITKYVSGRERPFVHALPEDQKNQTSHPNDNNLSFFSGHTSIAFSLVTASATVATQRGYRLAPFIWAIGLPLACLTGYLRIAADKHYMTDVMTGAAVGSAFGVGIPLLFHPRDGRLTNLPFRLSAGVSSQSATVSFTGLW